MKCTRYVLQASMALSLICACSCSFDSGFFDFAKSMARQNDKNDNGIKDENETGNQFDFLRRDEEKPIVNAQQTAADEEVREKTETRDIVDGKKLSAAEKNQTTTAKTASVKRAAAFYENFILLDADESVTVSLVFNSAPLLDVIPAFADVLGFNFVVDPELKSTISLNLNTSMTKRELWNTFDRVLSISGAGVTVDDSLLRIVPVSKLSRNPDLSAVPDDNAEVLYYPLRFVLSKEAAAQIKPFLSRDGVCMDLTRPNALLICDRKDSLPKHRQLLSLIDSSNRNKWPRAIIKCKNILPSKIAAELNTVLPILGFTVYQSTDKSEQPGAVRVSGIDRLQIITAAAATEEAINEIRTWVDILDGADSLDQERVFVYKVMNGKADQLMQALAVIYNTQGTTLTIDSSTGNNKTQNVSSSSSGVTRQQTTTNTSNNRNNNSVATAAASQTDQNSSIFENSVRVFADGTLNRLVVRTTPRTYASIKALLDRLDVVPAQVLLQVLVVEVTLNESTKFGLEFNATGTIQGNNVSFGQSYSDLHPNPTNLDTIAKDRGFTFTASDPNDPTNKYGYLQALAGNNSIKIISSPQVLVSSHTEAMITVGSRVPYVTSTLTDTASVSVSSTAYTSNVSYEDTGVTLTITPQVTSTNLIALQVNQVISSAKANTLTSIDAPEFPRREVKTNMTIQNGKTMIIGGLIQERKSDNLDTLPLINDIPFLRRLFGSTDASTERSEILILITGHIVNERSKTEEMIKRYNDALKSLNDFDSRLGDRPGANSKVRTFDKKDLGGKGF